MRGVIVALLFSTALAACARGPKQPWGWVREPVNKTVPTDVVLTSKAIAGAKSEETIR